MSQEYVEIVRAATAPYTHNAEAIEHLARGDLAFLGLFDPEIEWDASRLADVVPDLAQVYRGHEGVQTYWRRWLEAWRDIEFDIQDVLDAGDEVVVLIHNQRQWGRHTGIVSEVRPFAMIYTFRDGRVVRWRAFPDQDEALKAAGLAE
jgi:ketosteroid isomerase-like protein